MVAENHAKNLKNTQKIYLITKLASFFAPAHLAIRLSVVHVQGASMEQTRSRTYASTAARTRHKPQLLSAAVIPAFNANWRFPVVEPLYITKEH